jgi:hypothetical protein
MGKKDIRQLDDCKVPGCGLERRAHRVAETEDRVHHEFSTNGELVVLSKDRPKRQRGNSQRSSGLVRAGVGGDPVLRYVLINKGVITPEELDEAERILKATGALGFTPGLGRAASES